MGWMVDGRSAGLLIAEIDAGDDLAGLDLDLERSRGGRSLDPAGLRLLGRRLPRTASLQG